MKIESGLMNSFIWFAKEFELDVIRNCTTITPTPHFFPEVYTASYEEAEKLVWRIYDWMKINPQVVDLHFFWNEEGPPLNILWSGTKNSKHTAGLYVSKKGGKEFILAIGSNMIIDPVALVSTIAHELSHAHLIGSGRVKAKEKDQEPLTDLLAIYYGMGIFIANAAFRFQQWQNAREQGWGAKKIGYLPEPMIGYALALYAMVRGESNPPWARYLEYNVKVFFRRSLKYLSVSDLAHLSPIIEYTDHEA